MANSMGSWDSIDGIPVFYVLVILWTAVGVFVAPALVCSIIRKRNWWAMLGADLFLWIAAWSLPNWKGLWRIELLALIGCAGVVAGILYLADRNDVRRIVIGSSILVMVTTGVVIHGLRLQDQCWTDAHDAGVRYYTLREPIWSALAEYHDKRNKMPLQREWRATVMNYCVARKYGLEHLDIKLARYSYTGATIDEEHRRPLVYRYLSGSLLGVVPNRTVVLYTNGDTAIMDGWRRF